MGILNPKLGRWYESKEEVRAFYGEYWKGILLSEKSIAIIFNYAGARRSHYGDGLDYTRGRIRYIGEGKTGDQSENARNRALISAASSGSDVHVYLDCGDLFLPKRLLYAGCWKVMGHKYAHLKEEGRKVYQFDLEPADPTILKFLHFTFSAVGKEEGFERDLERFADARRDLYQKHPGILRARDNIGGEIGEYFAISNFNKAAGDKHLIRLTGSQKDIDAIRIGNGHRYAIKTISTVPSTTSNIWSKDIGAVVDYFLICVLEPHALRPRAVFSLSVEKAIPFLRKDKHQGSQKLNVTPALLKCSKFYLGKSDEIT